MPCGTGDPLGHDTTIQRFYIEFIQDHVKTEVKKQLSEMLQLPIEMTIEDIEKAFNHKIKIVTREDNQ